MVLRNKKVASAALSLAILGSSLTGVSVLAVESVSAASSDHGQQQSPSYIMNLRMANKVLDAAIQKGQLTSSLFDSLNAKMNALMERLDTIDNLRETAISEVEVTDDLLEIGHYQDATESVMAKREESVKILEQLQNKLGIDPSGHVLTATVTTKSPEVKILAATPSIQQYKTANVKIDGVTQKFDQSAVVIDGSTLVPMRGVFESLGATIKWDQATQTVTGTKGSTTIKLTIGNKYAHVNGTKVTLTKEALIMNGSTMVPLRFVAEALGSKVDWDAATYTAIITSVKGSDSGVTNPGTGTGTVVTNPTNPTNPTAPSTGTNSSYVVNGIDATQTQGRLYGSKSQKEYDAVVKIAKEALAKMSGIQIPQTMQDFLNGKTSNGRNNRYDLELETYDIQLSPLLNSGISKETIATRYKLNKVLGEFFGPEAANTQGQRGIESAYDSLVLGKVDCDSYSQAESLFNDLAGFNSAIVAADNHAYTIIKMDGQWTKLGKPIGTDANAHLKTVTGGYWLVAPN